jgi:hypothetical protein
MPLVVLRDADEAAVQSDAEAAQQRLGDGDAEARMSYGLMRFGSSCSLCTGSGSRRTLSAGAEALGITEVAGIRCWTTSAGVPVIHGAGLGGGLVLGEKLAGEGRIELRDAPGRSRTRTGQWWPGYPALPLMNCESVTTEVTVVVCGRGAGGGGVEQRLSRGHRGRRALHWR